MQTRLAEFIRATPAGDEAESILRKCVHCGFCNATCPTYRLLGNELDGPRGRIYLIKQLLEGADSGAKTQLHLDRCLTCRACETTCPSGVEYGRLADIGRGLIEQRVARRGWDGLKRAALAWGLPHRRVFTTLLAIGRLARPLLPARLAKIVPRVSRSAGPRPAARHARRMLSLAGCVQPALAPRTNAAAARVLDRLGISLLEPQAGCCGALRFHLGRQSAGVDDARAMVDALWPAVAGGGIEAIVSTASGCGAMLREYGHLLADDAAYAPKAAQISALTRDLAEVVAAEETALGELVDGPRATAPAADRGELAFHSPCTLQHAQRVSGVAERLLKRCGWSCAPVAESDQCCGSAGTYSILQPRLANALRERKLVALQSAHPDAIATANVGCQMHLQAGTATPVRHWIEFIDDALAAPGEPVEAALR
jgi:glycolate oxidase iron-sulfur subunit